MEFGMVINNPDYVSKTPIKIRLGVSVEFLKERCCYDDDDLVIEALRRLLRRGNCGERPIMTTEEMVVALEGFLCLPVEGSGYVIDYLMRWRNDREKR
jgi:hypothetical protein